MKPLSIWMFGVRVNFYAGRAFDHLPSVHDDDSVAYFASFTILKSWVINIAPFAWARKALRKGQYLCLDNNV